jgi:hypothetical protein
MTAHPRTAHPPGSKTQCKRCPRVFRRRRGRRFCMVCSGYRIPKRLRDELARNPRETP